jgi:hypothetical protein
MQGRPHQDLSCFILDLAPGWSPHTGHALGDDQLFRAEHWSEPVLLHPTPLSWYAARGVGVFIMDWIMSGPTLRRLPQIITDDAEFGHEVRQKLTLPERSCPEIRVRIREAAE